MQHTSLIDSAIERGLDLNRKFEDRDILDRGLRDAAFEFIREYNGNFDFMVDMKTKWNRGMSLSAGQLRGALNVLMAEYRREQKSVIEAEEQKSLPPTEWVGEINDRITVMVDIVSTKGRETEYGYSTIVKMVDEAGHHYVWFATGDRDAMSGRVQITGTVKAHNAFKGVKETVLTRCKVGGKATGKAPTAAKPVEVSTVVVGGWTVKTTKNDLDQAITDVYDGFNNPIARVRDEAAGLEFIRRHFGAVPEAPLFDTEPADGFAIVEDVVGQLTPQVELSTASQFDLLMELAGTQNPYRATEIMAELARRK